MQAVLMLANNPRSDSINIVSLEPTSIVCTWTGSTMLAPKVRHVACPGYPGRPLRTLALINQAYHSCLLRWRNPLRTQTLQT